VGRAVVVFVMRERGPSDRERHEVMHVVPYKARDASRRSRRREWRQEEDNRATKSHYSVEF
jgi:hypothetical protein